MRRAIIEILTKFFKENGIFFIRNVGYSSMRAGLPDFVLCLDGYFFAVKCTSGDKDLDAIQRGVRDDILGNGGFYWVVNEKNLDRFKDLILKKMKEGWFPRLPEKESNEILSHE